MPDLLKGRLDCPKNDIEMNEIKLLMTGVAWFNVSRLLGQSGTLVADRLSNQLRTVIRTDEIC